MPTTMRIMPTIPAGFTLRMLQRPATANQLDNEHDQRDEEQQMNVSTENMEADKTEKPENQQNNKDSPKHKKPFVCGCCQWFASTLAVALTENCTEDCSPRRIHFAGRTNPSRGGPVADRFYYWPVFLRTARKSQPLSSSCMRAES